MSVFFFFFLPRLLTCSTRDERSCWEWLFTSPGKKADSVRNTCTRLSVGKTNNLTSPYFSVSESGPLSPRASAKSVIFSALRTSPAVIKDNWLPAWSSAMLIRTCLSGDATNTQLPKKLTEEELSIKLLENSTPLCHKSYRPETDVLLLHRKLPEVGQM